MGMKRRGFTLVEILIVVVILGILAAIVIPLFTSATREAGINATITELQKIRRHINVYQIRNNQQLPTVVEGDGTWGEVVGRNYLLAPPVNSWIGGANSRTIRFGTGPDAAFPTALSHAWIFDQTTGEVWASGFDAMDRPLPR